MIYDLVYVFGIIVLAMFLWYLLDRAPSSSGELKRWGQWAILVIAGVGIFLILFRVILAAVGSVA